MSAKCHLRPSLRCRNAVKFSPSLTNQPIASDAGNLFLFREEILFWSIGV